MELSRSVTIWSAGSLTAWARRTPAGALVLEDQDLAPGMPRSGEGRWLRVHGIDAEFWCRRV